MKKIKIAPSILSANFGHLQEDINKVDNADYLHIDVMDGHFVPNITIGPVVLKDIKTELIKDVHLMIENPGKYVKDFAKAGADIITVHAETCKDNLIDVLDKIRELGVKAGVSLNPDSKLEMIENVLDKVDMVVMMTVFPGFSGQEFIESVMPKIRALREKLPELDIEVDGGINERTVKIAADAGANVVVAGSYIFCSENPGQKVEQLRNI